MDAANSRVWLTSIAQRVHVRITARQQNAIEALDHVLNKLRLWNKRDVNRQTASGFDGLTIIPSQIKSLGFQFYAHRDSDARPVLQSHSRKSRTLESIFQK